MKKGIFLIILFICLFSYKEVKALDTCVPDNTATFHHVKDINHEIGWDTQDYLKDISATDSCGNSVNITVNASEINLTTEGTYNLYYYAKGSSETVKVYVYYDLTPPVFSNVLDTIQVEINSTYDFLNNITANDNKYGDVTSAIVVDTTGLDYSTVGQYTVTYTVSDGKGNKTEKTVTVNVKDTIKPIITGYKDISFEVFSNIDEFDWWKLITVTDNSLKDTKKSMNLENINMNTLGSYSVYYIASDESSNEEQIEIKVHVVDTIAPEIKNLQDKTINVVQQLENIDFKAGIEITDNYDGTIDLSKLEVDCRFVNLTKPGVYPVFYFVTDSSNNHVIEEISVKVYDEDMPVISGAKDIEVLTLGAAVNYLEGVTADDLTDGDLTDQIKIYDHFVDLRTMGTYTLFYIVFDSSGNKAVTSVKIIIKDSLKPVISGHKNLRIEVNSTPNYLEGVTAIDNFDGDITSSIMVDASNVNLSVLGDYELIYTVEDFNGNLATEIVTVSVVDTTGPQIIGVKDVVIKQNQKIDKTLLLQGISVSDNLDGDLTDLAVVKGFYNSSKAGTYKLKVEVQDSQGNVSYIYMNLIVKSDKISFKDNNSIFYITTVIAVSLLATGFLGFRSRKRNKKSPK